MNSKPIIPPVLALFIGILAVSTGALFLELAATPALVKAAYRCGLATLLLIPFALRSGPPEWQRLTRRDWLLIAGAGICLALHFTTWVSSLDYTSIASSLVLVTTNPLWVALLTPLFGTDRVAPGTWLGIVVSVLGGVIIGWGDFQLGPTALWGDLLALLGAISAAGFLLIGRRVRQKLSLFAYVVPMYGLATLILLVFVLLQGLPMTGYAPITYFWLFMVALIPQVVGHTSYNWALQWFSPALIAVVLLGEPILGSLWGYLFLGQSVTLITVLGGGLILAGIYLAARAEHRNNVAQSMAEVVS